MAMVRGDGGERVADGNGDGSRAVDCGCWSWDGVDGRWASHSSIEMAKVRGGGEIRVAGSTAWDGRVLNC